MDVNLGVFTDIFLLESLYGMSTVSLKSLERSVWNTAYCGLLAIVFTVAQVYILFTQLTRDHPLPFGIEFMGALGVFVQAYTTFTAVIDFKSKISTALTLEAIEDRIKLENMTVPGKGYNKQLVRVVAVVLVLFQFMIQVLHCVSTNCQAITQFVIFKDLGFWLLQAFSAALFLVKVILLQSAIADGFQNVNQDCPSRSSALSRLWARRGGDVQTETDIKLKLLKEVNCSLSHSETKIQSFYLATTVWYRLQVELVAPLLFVAFFLPSVTQVQKALSVLEPITSFIFLFGIVFAAERAVRGKEELGLKLSSSLSSCRDETRRRTAKHQLLANIHRTAPFHCFLFDVDYNLLSDVLETSLFVGMASVGYIQYIWPSFADT